VGSQPRHLLTGVLTEGFVIAAIGVAAGGIAGFALGRVVSRYFQDAQMPGVVPVVAAAAVLLLAAVIASVLPAARAARVDVMQALRGD
jgi:ABC-type antimicrobial peptide transport system permease subunit